MRSAETSGEWGYRSGLCIRLVSGERVTGLIDVFDTRSRDYASHQDYLRRVDHVAAVIERSALADDLKRLSSMSAELAGLCRDLSAATSRAAVLQAVCSRVPGAVDAAACDLYWIADGRGRRPRPAPVIAILRASRGPRRSGLAEPRLAHPSAGAESHTSSRPPRLKRQAPTR